MRRWRMKAMKPINRNRHVLQFGMLFGRGKQTSRDLSIQQRWLLAAGGRVAHRGSRWKMKATS